MPWLCFFHLQDLELVIPVYMTAAMHAFIRQMTLLTDGQYLTYYLALLQKQVVNDSLLGAKVGLANHKDAAHHAVQLHPAVEKRDLGITA